MKMEKLVIKDLVTIGVFTVIYFVLMFLSGMVGMVPILYLAYPTLAGIITGIVIMLFMAKVQKPWGLFILGLICGFIVIAMGNTYVILIHVVISMAIAELLRKKGEYKSFKYNMLSFAVFNTWPSKENLAKKLMGWKKPSNDTKKKPTEPRSLSG